MSHLDKEIVVRVVVKRWGNSASVRIPATVMKAAGLTLDQPVEVREEDGRVVIEAVQPASFDLATLIAGITDENLHEPVDMGPPVGREVW
jgi:antitoxin MazE